MNKRGMPYTVAVIPDGNRRWAKNNLLNAGSAYSLGVKKFIDFSEWCYSYGVKNIIVWGLSTENTGRPANEINALFNVYRKAANDKNIIRRLHEKKSRLVIVGDRSLLPKDLSIDLAKIEKDTRKYKERKIFLLLGYGGRQDIMHVAKGIAAAATRGILPKSESSFKRYLLSKDVPDIDLVIRTSGEQRLSGFMPWQSAYSELYFCKKYWPDFKKEDLDRALSDYAGRERRFGV